ncbi:MAG TPA: hypothetical protein VKA84_26300, partial [Gemmatimonadaceae bacterium]|nr:hypothetical protein [Gemmatimonadaceae bacterium]
LLSVSGDTLRLRVDRAYSADGRSFQLPNGATGSVIRDADTRMDERRVSAGRTTALVAGVAAGAFLLLLAAALAAIADGVD